MTDCTLYGAGTPGDVTVFGGANVGREDELGATPVGVAVRQLVTDRIDR
jgi:hypothetical protein